MKSLATAVASILGFSSLGLAHAGVSDIVKDDRTETEIIEAGDTYTITTSTISGANAFNSFKTFDLAQTDTVNLVLPDSTSNLINLVWDSQALINGTLNSYFESAPGVTAGNVFFADPHGVVVGSTGSINVGALSLSAPSTGFMCGLLNDNGGPTCSTLGEPAPVIPFSDSFKVNVTAAGFTQLLQGSEPLAAGSKIDIQGVINATNAVRVRAQAIDVSGTIFVSGNGAGGFETAVNLGDSGTPTIVTDGNTIRLVADASDSASSGDSNATATVNVTGGLYAGYDTSDTTSGGTAGGSIVVSAHADASSAYGTAAGESTNDELLTKQADDLISSKTSVFSSKKLGTFGYVRANSTATVNLGGTAVLAATDDVELTSSVKTSATTLATVATKKKKGAKARAGNRGNFGIAIAAMYGSVTGNATTDVASGATVRVGDAFSVNALTDNTLNVAATTIAKTGEKGVATLAWSNADVHATANIASGSTVEAGGAVSVIARNTNNFSTAATTSVVSKKGKDGKEANGGKVGLAAAISIQNVQATASNGADLNGVDSLVIEANTITQSNSTVAATAFSSRKAKGTANSKQTTQANLSDNSLANSKGKSNFKVGAAIAWTDSNLTATASLADNAAITADGDVTVHARVVDGGIGNSATSSAVSKSKSSGSETSITAGIAVGLYTHDAQALVGKNASITASRIGVGSQVVLPFNWGEDNADAFGVLGTMWSDVGSFVEGVNTLANDVNVDYVAGLTSYAGASAKSKSPDSKAISGSVNWFEVTNTSKAWVDTGASLTATGTVADTGWSSTLDDGTLVDWGDAIAVAASTDLTSVNAVGDIEIFALAKTILKGAEANTAIGGAFNTVQFDNTTSAGVASDATLEATQAGVDVSAHSISNIVAISPVAGKGGENAISGTLALTDIDDKTQASISHDAKVTAERVDVDAHADMMVWAISGALAMSDTASVGLGVGVNQIDTDTRAWIGDNEGGLPGGIDGVPGVASGSGYVHTSELAVTARTQGQAGAITVSGTSTGGKSKNKAGDNTDSKTTTATTKQNDAVAGKAGDSSKSSGLASKAGGTGGDTAAKGGKFGLNISGAASVNLATLETRAYLQGADIAGKGTGSNSTIVMAVNQAELTSVAGSAAITRSGSKSDGQKFSATIAGAVAYTDIGNVTSGYIQDSTLVNADQVAVRALNAGEQLDIGIGIGSSGSTGKEPSVTLAGSVSVAQTANETSAYIGNSSVHGSASGSKRSLDVTAYDRSRIGVGGGSLVVSTGKNKSNGSAALALTYADIGNTTKAGISGHVGSDTDWDISGYDALTIHALDSSLIGAGALAAVIGNKNSNSLAGAFIWNDIGNSTSVFVDEGARLQIGGDVNLTAASTTPVDELDDLIDAAGIANSSSYDFGGQVLADNAADNKTANGSPSDPDAPNIDTLTEGGYGSSIIAVAGAVQSGKNNVGLSFVGSQVANTHEVSVVGAEIDAGNHSVALNANDNTRIISLAVGGGVSQGSFAGTGSMTYNDIGNTDRVVVGDASGLVDTSITAGAIDMGASDTSRIYSLAGNIAVSKKVAVGGALTWNKIHNTVESRATHATLTADAGTVDIGADNDALIMAGAVAGAVSTQSSGAAVGLAFGWNEGASNTTAKVDGATTVDAGSLNLVADNATRIYTLSGGVGIGGSVGVGAAANVADIHDTTTASLQNVGLAIDNAVDLSATGSGEAYSLAVGLAISKNAAVAASSTNNLIDNTVSAKASNLSGFNATTLALTGAAQASTLDITATNTAGAYALAGSVGGASTAGVGAAFATNVIEGKTEALLQNSVLAVSDSVDVDSTFDAVIQSVAIAGSGGGTAAVSGSSTINFITSDVDAGISNSGLDEAGNDTSVHATDTSRIDSLAGGIAIGGTAGVGAAVAVNRIGTEINAWMEGGADDRTWHAQNVTVQAEAGISDSGLTASPGGNINTVAVGGAGGGTAAVAGSLAVNLMDGEVHARIGDAADTALAADVVAEHNVGVLADSEQGINVFAGAVAIGGTAGVGAGVVVNSIQGDTGASIQGGSQVTALALDDTDTLAVSSGKLVNEDALNFSILGAGARDIDELADPANYVAPDLSMQTTNVTGVAVNASNSQHIATLGVAASGGGYAAVSAMGGVNVVGGNTYATIENASINQARQGDAAVGQQVDVRAASHQMEANFSIGVAASGGASVAAAVASNVFNADTQARIDDSTTDARGDVVVAANAGQGSLALAVGGAAGAVGVAASGSITIFDTTTLARVQNGDLAANILDVTAANRGSNTMIAGALAGGATAGSGAFLVNVAQSETTAQVDDVGSLDLDGQLTIDAATYNVSQAVGASGALGVGGGAVAGVGVVNVIKNTTTAELSDSTVTQADAVTVHASEEQTMDIVSGALAVDFAGVGVGAGINVAVLQSTVDATIGNSSVTSTGAVDVDADAIRDIDALGVAGGGGLYAGAGVAASLIIAGAGDATVENDGSQRDSMDDLNKDGNVDRLGSFTSGDRVDSNLAGSKDNQLKQSDIDGINGASGFDLAAALNENNGSYGRADGISAGITGSSIDAQSLTVDAASETATSNEVGGVGVGGFVGVGGALAYTGLYTEVNAAIDGASTVTVDDGITVKANAGDHGGDAAADVNAYAGAGGLVGIGAAVAVANVATVVNAQADGTLQQGAGTLAITAADTTSVNAETLSVSVGAVVAGASIVVALRDSTVDAGLGADAQVKDFGAVNITASTAGSLRAEGIGAAGGLAAGNAVVVVAEDESNVSAGIGDGSDVEAGVVSVAASATPQLYAKALGATLSGSYGLGASAATATVDTTVTSSIGDNVVLTGDDLTVKAEVLTNGSNDQAHAEAIAGTGGILLGASASVALASNTSHVSASTGNNVQLPSGDINILASNMTRQHAESLGISAGLLAVGASVANASSDTVTIASVGSGNVAHGATVDTVAGAMQVHASGVDSNNAKSVAGSGGLVAGNASTADTSATSRVSAIIGDYVDSNGDGLADGNVANADATDLAVASLRVKAEHETRYSGITNSVNAAALGASGAVTDNSANSYVRAIVGDKAVIGSVGDVTVNAENRFYSEDSDDGAEAAGGGVVSGQAALVTTELDGDTGAYIGDDTTILTGDDPNSDSLSEISVLANTIASTNDTASLSTGGAINVAVAKATTEGDFYNQVDVGDNAWMNTFGYITLGTYTQASLGATALVNTWGLAAVGSTETQADTATNQQVSVGENTLLEAFQNIYMTAGKDVRGLYSTSLTAFSNSQGYVRGLIAIPDSSATGNTTSNSSVTMGQGSQALAGRNVTAAASTGNNNQSVDGTGHGFQLGFIPTTQHDSDSNASATGTLTLDGTILAGRYNKLEIDIDASGNVVQASGMPVTVLQTNNFRPKDFLDGLGCSSGDGASDGCKALAALKGSVADGPVGAITLGPMFAAGGDVFLEGDVISGSGSATAQGAPSISVVNLSDDYLLLDTMQVPDYAGGRVRFTGTAGSASGVTVAQEPSTAKPEIYVYNGSSTTNGPAIFMMGDVRNIGGLVHIRNDEGSLGQFATVYAQQQIIEAPNGVVTFSNRYADWFSGSNPQSDWRGLLLRPGSPDDAVAYIAEAQYDNDHGTGNSLYADLLYRGRKPNPFEPGRETAGSSIVVYGACAPHTNNGNDGCSGGPYGVAWFYQSSMPWTPDRLLYKAINSYSDNPGVSANAGASSFVGQQIYVSARYIDVNSTIDAGAGTDWSLQVNSTASIPFFPLTFEGWKATVDASGNTTNVEIPWFYLSTIGVDSRLVKAWYDPGNNRILVDNINASGGGYVYLDGRIVSSTPHGKIQVSSGFGEVLIDSNVALPVTLQNINAGNGAVGVVEIVDQLKSNGHGDALTTWYVSEQGQPTRAYDNRNDATSYDNAYAISDAAHYAPKAGMRYRWTETAYVGRTVNKDTDPYTASGWQWTDRFYGGVDDGQQWAVSNAGFYQGYAGGPVFEQSVDGAFTAWAGGSIVSYGCEYGDDGSCNFGFPENPRYYDDGREDDEVYWRYDYPTRGRVELKASVKADNIIAIDFSGNDIGLVDVDAQGDIYVSGNISNPGGTTNLTAVGQGGVSGPGDILAIGETSGITTKDLTIDATGGAGINRALDVTLTDGGKAIVDAGSRGVLLDFASDAAVNIDSHDAGGYGDVVVSANGDISGINGYNVDVTGRNVNLTSRFGAIGDMTDALTLSAHETPRLDGGNDDGVVNAAALDDIVLTDVYGDLWIEKVVSDDGNVRLESQNGAILDARQRTAADTLTPAQVQDIWNTLRLDGSGVADTVQAFENQVRARYQEYWRLLDVGSVDVSGNFVLDATAVALFRPLAEAATGQSGLDDAQVLAYVDGRYADLAEFFVDTFGADWASQTPFGQFDSTYVYTVAVGSAQYQDLSRNSVWTQNQLKYSINANALEPSSGAVGTADPNVVGRNVTLKSKTGLGQLASDLDIDYGDLVDGALEIDEAVALVLANAPGDVVLVARDGHVFTSAELAALTKTDVENGAIALVRVKRVSPLFVDASGQFDGNAGTSAFLQSNDDLRLGLLSAVEDIRLAAGGNITGTDTTTAAITTGGDLVVQSGSGSIGKAGDGTTPATPLLIDVGERLLSASAGQDVMLRELTGDMLVGSVFANGSIGLEASDGSILSYLDGVTLKGHDINLVADQDIGRRSGPGVSGIDAPLLVEVAATGKLDGIAGGDIWIASSAQDLHVGTLHGVGDVTVSATIGNLSADELISDNGDVNASAGIDADLGSVNAGNAATLAAVGDLQSVAIQAASAALNAGGDIHVGSILTTGLTTIQGGGALTIADAGSVDASDVVISAASLDMGDGSAMTANNTIEATTTGDMNLGQLRIRQDASGPVLELVAGGHIEGNGDGQVNLVGEALNTATVEAATGIGTGGQPLTVAIGNLIAHTAQGNIHLQLPQGGSLQSVVTDAGDIVIGSDDDVGFGRIDSSGTLDVDVTGNLIGTDLVADGASLNVDASGDVGVDGVLHSGGVANINAGGNVDLATATVAGALNAQSGGDMTLDTADIGTTANLVSGGAMTLGALTSGGDLTADSAAALDAQQLTVGGNATLTSGAAMYLVNTTVANALNAQSSAGMTLDTTDIGSTADLASVGAMTLGTLSSGSDLNADSTATLDAQQLTVGGNATLASGDAMRVVEANIVGALVANSQDVLTLDTVDVGTTATLDSVGDMTLGSLTSGDRLDANAGGTLSAQSLIVGSDANLTSGAAMHLVDTTVANAINAQSGAGMTLDTANIGSTADLVSVGAMTLGTLSSGGDLNADSATTLDAQMLMIGGNAALTSGQAMHVVGAGIVGALVANSQDALTLDTVDVGTTATLDSVGDMTLGSLTSGDRLDANAGGALNAQSLTIGTDASLASGDAMHLVDTTVANALNAQSGTDMTLDTVDVGTTATLDSVGDMTLGSLTSGDRLDANADGTLSAQSLTVDSDANLTSGAAMHLVDTTVANALNAQSGTDMTLDTVDVGTTADLVSVGAMTLGTLSSGSDLTADSATTLEAQKLTVGGDATLTTGRAMHVVGAAIAGALVADSQAALTLDKAIVGATTTLDSVGDTTLGELSTGDWLDANAGGQLGAQILVIGSDANLVSGDAMHLVDTTITGALNAQSGADMTLDTANIGSTADLVSVGAMTLGTLSSGGDLNADSATTLDAQMLMIGGNAALTSGQAMHVAGAGIVGALVANSQDALTLDTIDVGTTATLGSVGDMTLGSLTSGDRLDANAGGALSAQSLTVGSDANLVSSDAMHVVDTTVTNALNAQSGTDMTLDMVDVGTTATLDSVGDMTLGSLTSGDRLDANAGGTLSAQSLTIDTDASLTSGDAMHLVDTTVANALNAQSGTDMTLDTANIGTTADLVSVGAMTLGTLSSGGDLTADSATTLDAQTLTIGGNAALTSGQAMHVVGAGIVGALVANSQDALTLDTIDVGTTATLGSVGDMTLGSLTSGDRLDANAGGALSAQSLIVGSDANLVSGDAMHLVDTTVTKALNAQSGAGMTLDTANIGTTADLASVGAMTLGTLSSGGDLNADSATTIDAQALMIGGNANLTSGDAMHLVDTTVANALNAQSGTGMTLDVAEVAGTTTLSSAASMTIGTLHGVGDIDMTAVDDMVFTSLRGDRDILGTSTAGNILGGSARAGRNLKFVAAGDIRFDELQAGTNLDLEAGDDIVGATAQALAGSVDAVAGHDMDIQTVKAGLDVGLEAGNAITLGVLEAGRDLGLVAGTNIEFGALTVGRNAAMQSLRGDISGGSVDAGGSLDANAYRDLTLDTASTGDDMRLHAGRDLHATALVAGKQLDADAGHDLWIQQFRAGDDVHLDSGADMFIGEGDSGGTQYFSVGRNLDFGRLSSATAFFIDVTGGYLDGGELEAPMADLAARDSITLDIARIGERLNLASADIDANVLQTGRDTALFSIITGYHGGVAQRVHLSVDTPQPWMIERLAAVQAAIETTTKQVRIVDGHIENTMRLITPSTNLWMDNQSVALSPADVQMHQINYDFMLDQDDRHTLTDAYVVRYGFGYEVVSPNYLAEHIWLAPNYLGESAMRYTGRTLTEHMAEDDIDPGLTGAQSLEQEDPVRTGLKGAINVGVAN